MPEEAPVTTARGRIAVDMSKESSRPAGSLTVCGAPTSMSDMRERLIKADLRLPRRLSGLLTVRPG